MDHLLFQLFEFQHDFSSHTADTNLPFFFGGVGNITNSSEAVCDEAHGCKSDE